VAEATPWRAELAAMKKQLHDEMRAQSASTASVSAGTVMSDTEFRRRVSVLLDESERKQEKQLALQIVQLQQDLNVQRQSDLGQVYQALGLFQNTTRGELLNQRQALRMAVSQTK
jgi:16S rRNA C1402 N4-methylase RsmH